MSGQVNAQPLRQWGWDQDDRPGDEVIRARLLPPDDRWPHRVSLQVTCWWTEPAALWDAAKVLNQAGNALHQAQATAKPHPDQPTLFEEAS